MFFSVYELVWMFLVYSFLGWVMETLFSTLKQCRFANRGLVSGPFCIIYGIAVVIMSVGLQELKGVWLFLFVMVCATVIEWIGGHLIEIIYHERWWNYSAVKWNLDGYICLYASLYWGCLGFLIIRWGNDLLLKLFHLLPGILMHIIQLVLVGLLLCDVLASYIIMTGRSKHLKKWETTNNQIICFRKKLGRNLIKHIVLRIHRAYPQAVTVEKEPKDKTVFASGCDFYKIALLFILGAFLGDIIETIFCRLTAGVWMSRSSVVWGPFSLVWGLALSLVTALLYKYKDRSESFLFCIGTFLGGAYEYLCSVFTEIVFGKVFWDYSHMAFNLGGRINLLFCFFWGIAAVVWFKIGYPFLSTWIEKLPVKLGKCFTWICLVFMTANIAVTSVALFRYDERGNGIKAEKKWQQWADEHYDDVKMEKIYPNAKKAG